MTTYKTEASNLTDAIIDFLNNSGHFAWRNNKVGIYDPVKNVFRKGGRNSGKGSSDVLCALKPNGQLLAIEVKIDRDKPDPDQIKFKANTEKTGAIYWVCKTIEDFQTQYKSLYAKQYTTVY